MPAPHDSQLVSANEAARVMGISPGALAQLRRRGKGPAYEKHGARVLYRLDSLSPAANPEQTVRPLLTAREVAELLAVTESALSHWRWRGVGPAWMQIERSVRYRAEDIETYLAHARRAGE